MDLNRQKVFTGLTGRHVALVTGVVSALCTGPAALAQPADRSYFEEVIVTTTGRETRNFETPFTVLALDSGTITNQRQSRSLPEIFFDEPSILVQKTANGHGSPYMRGFTGFRTLLLIDGIRINNSIFREGPNQYWATLDPFTIDQLEVVKGPSSILYGSDSIGGTVNLRSQSSFFGSGSTERVGLRSVSRLSSADDSFIQRLEGGALLNDRLELSAGLTLKDYGDVKAGAPTGVQPHTGYDENDGDFRLEYRPDDDSRVIIAHQQVQQQDVWRTHSTNSAISWHGTSIGSDKIRMFDQFRSLSYVQYHTSRAPLGLDAMSLSVSRQDQDEQRNRLRSNDRFEIQGIEVDTLGLSFQGHKDSDLGLITIGTEYYEDDVASFFTSRNPNGTVREVRIQGPVADDANVKLLGIYAQDEIGFNDDRGILTLGLRYTNSQLEANQVIDPVTGNPTRIEDEWDQLTASARVAFLVSDNLNIYTGVSQGFRAPNLSDLTRLDTARTNEIETPTPNLEPEDFISYEVGAKYRSDNSSLGASYYYTDISKQIIRYPTGAIIDGNFEVQKANVGEGYVQGVELNTVYDLNRNWQLFAAYTWTEGEVSTYPTSAQLLQDEPIDRMLPSNGIVGVRWNSYSNNGLQRWLEFNVRSVSKHDELSSRDQEDTSRIPPGGNPGYTLFNLRSSLQLTEKIVLSAALDNISDKDYRVLGSGQNEPGRNFLVSLDLSL